MAPHSPSRVIIVGGSFSTSLAALALHHLNPACDFVLVNESRSFGGNAAMPAYLPGLSPREQRIIDPLIVREWPEFIVSSNDRSGRTVGTVGLLDPSQLHLEIIERISPDCYRLDTSVRDFQPGYVELNTGERLFGEVLLSDRTIRQHKEKRPTFQLIARDIRFNRPHALTLPVLMALPTLATSESPGFLQYIPLSEDLLRIHILRRYRSGPIATKMGGAEIAEARLVREASEMLSCDFLSGVAMGRSHDELRFDFASILCGHAGSAMAKARNIAERYSRSAA